VTLQTTKLKTHQKNFHLFSILKKFYFCDGRKKKLRKKRKYKRLSIQNERKSQSPTRVMRRVNPKSIVNA
jgi:hypothetical protein